MYVVPLQAAKRETTTPHAIGPTRGAYSKLSLTVNAETKTHLYKFHFFAKFASKSCEKRRRLLDCQILRKSIQDIILWHCKFLEIVCFHTLKYAAGMLMSK